ncbi:hypothetical protein LMG26685_00117 [Achromobacter mucicolens]|uniref:hypothetical protein n=1 Tax=Achromobacter mucicolens TaxID=1389922 RepID=UPI0009C8D805|nr:hypothetical protein [Achromobacter mucicolens]OXC89275.1 hypothetical protein BMR85_019530 [Achromobacter sp. KAs 3-5]CAB3624670.1 hypothetical protein LMG26685_00117 [Achromobacter mucicolens]
MSKNVDARGARTENLQSAGEVFRVPIWLGVASVVGLVSALLGDGVWDGGSWLAIFAPVGAVWWAWRRRGG